MAVFTCRKCGQMRARGRNELCPVCWLLEDFLLEHREGKHKVTPAHGCGRCSHRLRAQLRPKAVAVLDASDDVHELAQQPQARSERPQSSSHATCAHDNTKAARAKCRAARRKGR